jgi:hypothetical protein
MDKKVIYYFLKITLLTFAFLVVINLTTGFLDNFNINNIEEENKETVINQTKADQNSETFVAA